MTTFEISSNLTTEEIKEKIREIGYFRYPILREKNKVQYPNIGNT